MPIIYVCVIQIAGPFQFSKSESLFSTDKADNVNGFLYMSSDSSLEKFDPQEQADVYECVWEICSVYTAEVLFVLENQFVPFLCIGKSIHSAADWVILTGQSELDPPRVVSQSNEIQSRVSCLLPDHELVWCMKHLLMKTIFSRQGDFSQCNFFFVVLSQHSLFSKSHSAFPYNTSTKYV